MTRNLIGSLLALVAAAAAVYGVFQDWFNGRAGIDYRLTDLFWDGITPAGSPLWISLFLPMLFAAVVTLAGVLLRSRALVMFAGVVVLGFTILWLVRQGQAAGTLTVGDAGGINRGVAFGLGSGLLMLIAGALMAGRRKGRAHGRYGAAAVGDGRVHSSAHVPLEDRDMAGERGMHGDEGMGTAAAAEHPQEPGRVRRLGRRRNGHHGGHRHAA